MMPFALTVISVIEHSGRELVGGSRPLRQGEIVRRRRDRESPACCLRISLNDGEHWRRIYPTVLFVG